ncbi:RNA-directed DNA polymerase (reverse transcriptase)-related family protein [Rhynchospora pubera]|uniref:RNA-directed DNA polymerase (Reverse transcriptase)-related family protein n=1 Tax=Rhynchospora pubera TaxID=906938 RepID=A0AAV8EC25_9POAL|nr:RNA-directed DNA polymerase (reverse transcriptase)-related family protein [Rhynchospora pubera]
MLQTVSLSIPHGISSKFRNPYYLLQYADDTMIFSTIKGRAVRSLQLALHLFSRVSGLRINLSKTAFVPFNLQQSSISTIERIFSCGSTSLPLQYLGLPLTINKPDRLAYQRLIDKLDSKLAGWKSGLISRAGSVVFASSVLSTIPIYFMSVFALPAWVVRAINKIRRDFIWGRGTSQRSGLHLINWNKVCLPKTCGGLGISDLKIQNTALLLRWLWRLYDSPNSQWSVLANRLYSKRNGSIPPLAWNLEGSFFWKDLLKLRYFFQISTRTILGNGKATLFWYDNWATNKPVYFLPKTRRPLKPHLTVAAAQHNWHALFPSPLSELLTAHKSLLDETVLSIAQDRLVWKWTSHGHFSVASTYKALITAGKAFFPCCSLWNYKVPPTIRLFLFFLVLDRLSTQEQLHRRNITVPPGCPLYASPILETALHLFFDCPFSARVYLLLGLSCSLPPVIPSGSVRDSVQMSFDKLKGNQFLTTVLATSLHTLWLERNNRIFRGVHRSEEAIADWILTEGSIFHKHCT